MRISSGGGGRQSAQFGGKGAGSECRLGVDGGGYCIGQCVDLAWKKRPDLFRLGNADSWLAGAQARGISTGHVPAVGAVAWWSGTNRTYADSSAGHVAYVTALGPGTVTFEEMNGPAGENRVDTQTMSLSSYYAPQAYIYGGPAGTGPVTAKPIPASATAPEGTRLVEQGSTSQYLSVLGAVLPISYADAQALDAEGNNGIATAEPGYLAAHLKTLPAGTRVRPDGQLNQYVFDGTALHYVPPAVASCLDNDHVQLHTVPTAWSGQFPVGANAPCGLPDETRFVEAGSLTQYLSVLGAALPMSYADAQALDADGNTAIATVPAGYVSGVPKTLPAGTWIRPDGQLGQYVFNGSSLEYVDSATSECLRNHGRILYTVPTMWAGAFPVSGTQAACS